MAIFSWARPTPLSIRRRVDPDRRTYVISDLHLGDGTRSDSFLGKDRDLLALLERVRDEGARLVIAGDAIDFHQAWAMSRVLRAHARLMGELARMAEHERVIYIWGNHDYDINLFRELLRFDVCSALEIGDEALVLHGYEFDPFIGPNLDQTHVATRIHHLVERLAATWIRLPVENFYTRANRLVFWLVHKAAVAGRAAGWLLERVGRGDLAAAIRRTEWYWTQAQLGDPGCVFEPARAFLESHHYRWLLTGHSHLPGIVEVAPGRTYVNTGSWTFDSSQYAVWDGGRFTVHDWTTGRELGDAAYRPLLERRFRHMDFFAWWRENHLGRARFRVAEEVRPPRDRP